MGRAVLFLSLVLLIMTPGSAIAQDTYYVQSLKAKILSEPSFKARAIGEASKGAKLMSSGRQGSWVKVVLARSQEGYVSSLLVTKYPPIEKRSVIKGDETDLKQSVRRRASTYTSAAAARGLAQDDRRRLSSEEKTDYHGLERMEAVSIRPEELSGFMEGNKL